MFREREIENGSIRCGSIQASIHYASLCRGRGATCFAHKWPVPHREPVGRSGLQCPAVQRVISCCTNHYGTGGHGAMNAAGAAARLGMFCQPPMWPARSRALYQAVPTTTAAGRGATRLARRVVSTTAARALCNAHVFCNSRSAAPWLGTIRSRVATPSRVCTFTHAQQLNRTFFLSQSCTEYRYSIYNNTCNI